MVVVSTAYHLVLAHLLPGDERFPGRTLLVLTGRREQIARVREAMTAADCHPFDAIESTTAEGPDVPAELARRRALCALDAHTRAARVVVFNDQGADIQALCRAARARGARVLCGEDGGAAYSQRSFRARWRRHMHRVARFGPWVRNPVVPGAAPGAQATLAVFPHLLRPELRARPPLALGLDRVPDFLRLSWTTAFLRELGLSAADLVFDEVYAPTYSGAIRHRDELRAVLREHLRMALSAGHACAVKYHPRERGDYLDAAALGATVLPAALPVEFVYQASAGRLRTVYGDSGTALLSARWLAPQARAVSAMAFTGVHDPRFAEVLSSLAVEFLPGPDGATART